MQRPEIDPVTKRKNGENEISDFTLNSKVELGGLKGKTLGKNTWTLDTKNLVSYRTSKKSDGYFPR